MNDWTPVAASADVEPGSIVETTFGDDDLVVWRTDAGRPCVMDARCPHQWSHLAAEGVVDGDEIVCTSHWWRFDVQGSGTILRSTGDRDVTSATTVHPCLERDGSIWIRPHR